MQTKKLFSSLVGTGLRLTILTAMLMVAFIGVAPAAALGPIDFTAYTLSSYGGGQDGACGSGATFGVPNNQTLSLTGNCWKKIALSYNVTANTILEFDFESSAQPEISGIGFDTDDTINNPQSLILQVYGTQAYGTIYNTYSGSGVTHYVIPVGTYYTGSFTSLFFVNDDDAAPIGNSTFSNIQVYEGTPPSLTVTVDGSPVSAPIESYGAAAQDVGSTTTIEDSGATLHIVGNGWKKVGVPYNVTTDTVLEFDFSSGAEGEIHGIGFDTDDNISNPIQIFQLFGTQVYGNQTFNTYTTGAGVVHYSIPVGTFYTGSFLYLTFTNDHDVASPTAESIFSNVVIHGASTQVVPTITFDPAPAPTYPGADFTVNATTDSDGALTYSYVSGPCSLVDGNLGTFTPTGVGDCVVQADTAATANFFAGSAQQTVTISSAGPATSTFDLYAVTGSTILPGQTVPVWGYNDTNAPVTQPGGPTLVVDQGDLVTINLFNTLSEQTALLIQGQAMPPDLTGVASGGSTSYMFTASKPGTFLYEAGLLPNSQHQVAMGLYGALIVRPTGAPSQAYADSGSTFDVEQVLVLSELDPALNNSADPATFDIRQYSPKYYLINGKAYPDTDTISVTAGDTLLLRYVNAGLQAHSMSTLGLTQTIIAQDGNANAFGRRVVAETIATGQTLDTLVEISGAATQYPLYDASLFLRNNTGNNTFAGLGGMLTMVVAGTPVLPGDTVGPVTSLLGVSPNPTDGSVDVTLTASVSDVTTGNSNIAAAEYFIDSAGANGSGTAMTGAFASPTESVSGTITSATLTGLSLGNHTIYVHGQDSAGNWGSFATITLTLETTTPPPTGETLYFSTTGSTSSGPSGVGADSGDIYAWDGSIFSMAINAPDGANVDGFDRVSATEFYMSFTSDGVLPGGVSVQNEDVAYFDGANWSIYFDGTANGFAASNVDAFSIVGSTLYFSTSDTTLPTGVTGVGDDADIYAWDGSTVTRVYDATALGWSGNNVDGMVFLNATQFYLSYSPTSTPVSGLGIVQDEDVVFYDNGVWSMYFDGTSNGLTSTSLDMDAFHLP